VKASVRPRDTTTAPLRILHAVRSDGFAGVERHVASLAAAQVDAGHRVAVIGGDPGPMGAAIDWRPVRRRPAVTTWDTVRGIEAFANCDVLHVHMTAAEFAAVLALRAWHVPVVTTRHFAAHRGTGVTGKAVALAVAPRISAQIAISRYVGDHVEGRSVVVLPGVPVVPDVPSAGREPMILVAQRLEAEKDTDVAIRAFASSGLAASGWRLEVAGDGARRDSLQALAVRLGIEDAVRLLGRRSDVGRLMARASALLAPCAAEGLGLTVMEAMAAGLPVVAARAGGHVETVGAVGGGVLFAPGDAETAGRALVALAEDPAGRAEYGIALREYQRAHFTLEAQEAATAEVYRSVL